MKIHLIAPYIYNYDWGLESRLVSVLRRRGIEHTITDMRVFSSSYCDYTFHQNYDLTIVLKGEMLNPYIIRKLAKPVVLWFPDDIVKYEQYALLIKQNGSSFDIVYSFDEEAIPRYKELGCKDVRFLPPCTGSDIFYYQEKQRDIDVSFCCSMNHNRNELLTYLRANKIDVYNESCYGRKLADVYNRSKIVINQAQGDTGISQRVFEGMACGALVLTNRIKKQLFTDYKDLVYWDTPKDLLGKIKEFLENEKLRTSIAYDGMKNVHSNHMMDNRLDQILKDVGLHEK